MLMKLKWYDNEVSYTNILARYVIEAGKLI